MSGWGHFDSQFAETDWERRERWAALRTKRKAEGKCWQCAKLIADCTCPNVTHPPLAAPHGTEEGR